MKSAFFIADDPRTFSCYSQELLANAQTAINSASRQVICKTHRVDFVKKIKLPSKARCF